jgi:hypothetical protein
VITGVVNREARVGYRVFKDSEGTEWQAWDVVPQLVDRRVRDRRAELVAHGAERRRQPDRRVVAGRRPVLSRGLDGGWLCFEAPVQKRRLTPIPRDWLVCGDEQLERYCQAAKPAARGSGAIDISALLQRQDEQRN